MFSFSLSPEHFIISLVASLTKALFRSVLFGKFPAWCSGLSIPTLLPAVAQCAAAAWVPPLAQEFPHAMSVAKREREKEREVYCLISRYLGIFQISFGLELISNSVPLWVRKHSQNDFNPFKFIKSYFMAQLRVSW